MDEGKNLSDRSDRSDRSDPRRDKKNRGQLIVWALGFFGKPGRAWSNLRWGPLYRICENGKELACGFFGLLFSLVGLAIWPFFYFGSLVWLPLFQPDRVKKARKNIADAEARDLRAKKHAAEIRERLRNSGTCEVADEH